MLVLGGAALKLNAVHTAGIIQLGVVAVLQGAVGNFNAAGNALALALNAVVHILGGDIANLFGDFNALVIAQLYLGHYENLAGKFQVLAGFHHINAGQGRGADGVKIIFPDGGHISVGEDNIQRVFIEDGRAVHFFDQLAGRLTLAEAGHGNLATQLEISLLDGLLEIISGHLESDLYFVTGQFFDRMFHVCFLLRQAYLPES